MQLRVRKERRSSTTKHQHEFNTTNRIESQFLESFTNNENQHQEIWDSTSNAVKSQRSSSNKDCSRSSPTRCHGLKTFPRSNRKNVWNGYEYHNLSLARLDYPSNWKERYISLRRCFNLAFSSTRFIWRRDSLDSEWTKQSHWKPTRRVLEDDDQVRKFRRQGRGHWQK